MILLLDERFRNTDYRPLFPVEWTDRKFCTIENVENILSGFWGTHNEKNELGIDSFI